MVWAWLSVVLAAGGASAVEQAHAQEEAGDAQAALGTLRAAVTADPTWVLARLELGRLQLARGVGLEAAFHQLDLARSLAPENPRAHYLFALAADEQGHRAMARRALEVALALRPDYADASYRLAGLLIAEGRHAEAVQALRSYLATHPEATGARLQLATSLERAGDAAGAEEALRTLMEAPAQRALAAPRLADLLERSGRKQDAQALRESLAPRKRQLRQLKPSRR